ncbi:hypothetical protein Bcen2424_3922 [Burkholderia cenocepacia HI2424]|nr:hypothetical protein Bcen2424_3922 [Burkholderia cenocepacia HI2424]
MSGAATSAPCGKNGTRGTASRIVAEPHRTCRRPRRQSAKRKLAGCRALRAASSMRTTIDDRAIAGQPVGLAASFVVSAPGPAASDGDIKHRQCADA